MRRYASGWFSLGSSPEDQRVRTSPQHPADDLGPVEYSIVPRLPYPPRPGLIALTHFIKSFAKHPDDREESEARTLYDTETIRTC